jgi:hypothetical protein
MFGAIVDFFFILLLAIPAIVFSILAFHQRTNLFLILGIGFTIVLLAKFIINATYYYYLIESGNILIVFYLFLLSIPIIFLIRTKTVQKIDENISNTYLDDIINEENDDL